MNRRKFLQSAAFLTAASALPALAQTAPKRLRLALLPDENAATIIQNAQPLKDHLTKQLGMDVEIVVTTDYSSMIEAARFGRIEVAYFGPLSYLLAKSKAPGLEPFAVGMEHGTPTYNSIVIARTDGPVHALEQVRGTSFAFGDQASTSSHLMPRAMLKRAGLDAEKDYKPVYLGAHDAVARAVQAGQVPAGGMSKIIFETLVQRKTIDPTKVHILATSDPIPNYPLVLQDKLPQDLKEKIRSAFLNLHDKAILKAFRVDGFAPTTDAAYDVLRDTAKVLDLDLAKLSG